MRKTGLLVGVAGIVLAVLGAIFYNGQSVPSVPSIPEFRVVVVGGGLAGLSAAIEAARSGAFVTIVDKEKNLGGNSAKASSGINAVGTPAQVLLHSGDSSEVFVSDTIASGHGYSDEALVRVAAEQSSAAVDFLTGLGVRLDLLSQCGGHSYARTHRQSIQPGQRATNIGFTITSALKVRTVHQARPCLPPLCRVDQPGRTGAQGYVAEKLEERITVLPHTRAVRLVREDGEQRVTGVVVVAQNETHPAFGKEVTLEADSVVLATGGYGANKELLAQHAPYAAGLSTTNGPFASGDGLAMATSAGATLNLMDRVQVHPTCFVDPTDPKAGRKFLAPEALRGSGGILLNHDGKRFVDELGLRDHVTKAIFSSCSRIDAGDLESPVIAHLLLGTDAVEKFQAANLAFYKFKKIVSEFENVEDFARERGLDAEAIRNSIRDYQLAADHGEDSFGKVTFPTSVSPDDALHAMMVTPCVHYTMGGVQIDRHARVLDSQGKPIPGLFAAGEVTGGLHGANRLAGNSLLECTVFGRIAGKGASGVANQNKD